MCSHMANFRNCLVYQMSACNNGTHKHLLHFLFCYLSDNCYFFSGEVLLMLAGANGYRHSTGNEVPGQ